MPLFLLAMAFARRGGMVELFVKAGAVSAGTARKPASVGAKDMVLVNRAAKRGSLVATNDGRFYANLEKVRRGRKRFRFAMVGAAVVVTALLILVWHPWT